MEQLSEPVQVLRIPSNIVIWLYASEKGKGDKKQLGNSLVYLPVRWLQIHYLMD
jgi:hypothetical protein